MSAADDEISILEEEQEPENSIFEAQQDTAAAVAACAWIWGVIQ